MRNTSSREFNMWKIFLEREPNDFNPLHYYLANIVAELDRVNSKHPERIKTEDKILKFVFEQPKTKKKATKDKVLGAKRYLFGALALSRAKNRTQEVAMPQRLLPDLRGK